MDWNEADVITHDKFLAFQQTSPSEISYMKMDTLFHGRPIMWRGKPHAAIPTKVWITGHSDYGLTPAIYARYRGACSSWFAVNKEVDQPNVFAIPLGITNDCDDSPIHRIYGNTRIMYEVAQEPQLFHPTALVYMNFSIPTYPAERQPVFDMFKDKSWVHSESSVNTLEGRKGYLRQIRNHKFTICPRGNGLDTHRLWETLYMGSIPIVRRETALTEFTDLPICWIDSWDQVTPEFLESEFARIRSVPPRLEKLKMSYWTQKIANSLSLIV